jgi:ankyrin repeat protein
MGTTSPKQQRDALLEAILGRDVDGVQSLLKSDLETNFDVTHSLQPMITSGSSVLHMLIYLRQMTGPEMGAAYLQIMRLLIMEGSADPNRLSHPSAMGKSLGLHNYRDTPLHFAASMQDVAAVNVLLQCNADPAGISVVAESAEAPVGIYSTALHCTAQNDNDTIAQLLIAAGADVNAAAIGGITPMQVAKGMKHLRVLAVLREAGAKDGS